MSTPIAGQHGKITYGSGPTTLAITNWSYKPMANPIDVSNTTDGRRRIAGLGDAEGSFDVHVDTAATMEADLAPGTILAVNMFTDGTKKYAIANAIIDTIEYKVEVEGTYDASISWKLASGSYATSPS
jgi:hypothetical protein